ncbi:hypothetical protein MUA52_11995 [Staphylococcus agnetis]|uniref:hypothetical protein n=1 Tax=Staphylococcus agnetis TaxID=985762 RepID=UPI0021D10D59|nr:hypothetical protein [Staphylococcus agnetis]UXU54882.1 hypothetical protein MUA11_11450 [Staphylococcus agnetis]UXU64159.1 hypothetical protein MUA84_11760 [Staphylococcus agnetis]UXU66500.1 hypothetical protein MUA52_11995 [Staphylococcus agnetis]
MNSNDILINMFPDALQQIIRHQRYDDILGYFLEENINDSKLAYHLSVLATHIDTIPCHESVGTLFHFHFNYLEDAYHMAYYHFWRSLELCEFSDTKLLEEFLKILEEPDFDIVDEEAIEKVSNKIKK